MTNTTSDEFIIFAGYLFDPFTLELVSNQQIVASKSTGLVVQVRKFTHEEYADTDFSDQRNLDLTGLTVLPGFVDVHVHLFLHPYSETSWEDQLTKESLAERTIRATVHAKRTLMAGFTTVRDLGTEGAGDADLGLRKALSGPTSIIPGPRYFTANRALVPTGAYGPKSSIHPSQSGIDGITGADVVDGPDECIKAVRRQIGAGADWIKVYGDSRFRSRTSDVLPAIAASGVQTFNEQEIQAIVNTAHQYGVKVAVHSSIPSVIRRLLKVGVDSIEHGSSLATDGDPRSILKIWSSSPTFWVPTLAAVYQTGGAAWEIATTGFKLALEIGMERLAVGGDTGVFAHGDNALEMQLMVRLGANWRKVLRWATLHGWYCVRPVTWEGEEGQARLCKMEETGGVGQDATVLGDNGVPFGAIRRGWAADIVGVRGNLEGSFEEAVTAQAVQFVMKGSKIHKKDGVEVAHG